MDVKICVDGWCSDMVKRPMECVCAYKFAYLPDRMGPCAIAGYVGLAWRIVYEGSEWIYHIWHKCRC